MARIVFVTGDKGGVGKSHVARALLDWLMASGRNVSAFDTDKTNSTLFRFYSTTNVVQQLDVDQVADLDDLLTRLETHSKSGSDEILLVDCAARTLNSLLRWMRDIGFEGLKAELGFKMTLAFVIGPELDCVSILKDVIDDFGSMVEYVIIKNLGKGTNFTLYDESNTRRILREKLEASEIMLPALLEKTNLLLDRKSLAYASAIDSEELQIADRSRIRSYRGRLAETFHEAVDKWT